MITLRSETDPTMERMVQHAEETVRGLASAEHLEHAISYEDVFPSTQNNRAAMDTIRKACGPASVRVMDDGGIIFMQDSSVSPAEIHRLRPGKEPYTMHVPAGAVARASAPGATAKAVIAPIPDWIVDAVVAGEARRKSWPRRRHELILAETPWAERTT